MSKFLPAIISIMDGLSLIFSGNDGGVKKITEGINSFVKRLSETIPRVFQIGEEIISGLSSAIVENLPTLLTATTKTITTLLSKFSSYLPSLLQQILPILPEFLELGLQAIVSIATGISKELPSLMSTIVDVVLQIVEILTSPDNLSMLLSAALVLITELAFGLVNNIDKVIDAVYQVIDSIVSFIIDGENLGKLIGAAIQIVIAIGQGIIKAIPQLLVSVTKMYTGIGDTFKSFDWASLGINLVNGFANGISKAWGNLKEWFKNLFGDLVYIAKKILGIASPSKVFRRFGIFVDEGLKGGIQFGAKDVFKTVENLASGVTASFNPDLTADYTVRYNNNTANQSRFGALNAYNNGTNKTEVVVSIDDSISPLSFARYLLPFLKVAQKEAFA